MSAANPSVNPAVALVFSPESWVEELHRHLSHHGGARVRQIVVEPSVALEEEYDVLVVSDRWPALTHGFVVAVRGRGRRVMGVFDPEEPAGKDHLLELGVDAIVASDAEIEHFVTVLHDLEIGEVAGDGATPHRSDAVGQHLRSGRLVPVSGPRGSGVTEVALGVAVALAGDGRSVALVDAHESAPALAGRLGLPLEPNLQSAIDACAHGLGTLDDCVVAVDVPRRNGCAGIAVVPGHPSARAASQASTQDVLDVVAAVRAVHDVVVVDLEARSSAAEAVTGVADAVVGVVHASPVGVVRALEWAADALGHGTSAPLHLVVNHAPRGRFRQEEIRAEIVRTIAPASIAWCPHDRVVEQAAWDGLPAGRGAFRAACARLASAVEPAAIGRGDRWAR